MRVKFWTNVALGVVLLSGVTQISYLLSQSSNDILLSQSNCSEGDWNENWDGRAGQKSKATRDLILLDMETT